MAENKQEKPKIVVDDDWKAQAQAEKEKLAQQAEKPAAGAKSQAAGGAARAAGGEQHELPPASFTTLVSSLMSQVLYALGGYPDPRTKQRYVDLDLAKHHVDTLAMLEEKTQGHLTDEEKALLDRALYETRMQYVQMAQRVSSM